MLGRSPIAQSSTTDGKAEEIELSPEGREILSIIGKCRCNVVISGGTGSGKTTLLNCLTGYIEHKERVITCEDSAELQLQQPHVVRLETRPPSPNGDGQVIQRDLVRNALRMRPDRIIVGEVRGAETFDMLQAMNTGHDGSMTTVHANSARDSLGRLEQMVTMTGIEFPASAIRSQIASGLHFIVHLSRLADGSRRVTSISEITGMEGEIVTMQDIFVFQKHGRAESGARADAQTPQGSRSSKSERPTTTFHRPCSRRAQPRSGPEAISDPSKALR